MMFHEGITGAVVFGLDTVFFPLTMFQPIISLLISAIIITVIITVLNRLFVNKDLIKQIKDRMEQIRESLTQAQKLGNKEEIDKYLSELMKTNGEYMRQSIKTMIVSMVVIVLFLPWLSFKYGATAVAVLPFTVPFIGSSLTWIFWYALVSIAIGWLIKKLLGLEYA